MAKKIFLMILVLAFVGLGIFVFMRYKEAADAKEKSANQKREAAPPVVNVVDVKRMDLVDERIYSGTTQPWSSFSLDPEVSARLLKLNFDIGDAIKRNDLIAQLEDTEFVESVRQAEADLEVAKARFAEATELSKLRHSEYERQALLLDGNATSISEFEAAESAMKVQDATARQCEASILNCEAKLASAKVKLGHTKITANWTSGSNLRHVGDRYVDEGALVSPGKPLLTIIEIDRIKAKIQIIERDFRFLKVGQVAEITTDAFPGKVFKGTVSNISNELSENTRNVTAIVEIPNKDIVLRPGMFVRVRIVLGEHKNAQTLPPNAIVNKNNQNGIFVVGHGTNLAKFIPVTTGFSNRNQVEILTPENITEKVVTIGNHLLENGKPLVISELSRLQMAEKLAEEAAAKEAAQPANTAAGDKK